MKILEKTKYIYKKIFPSFYWFHKVYGKQTDAGKKYEKIRKETNGLRKIQ
jgi:hypothetical protein